MKTLYLGTEPSDQAHFHYPVIKVEPRCGTSPDVKAAFSDLKAYTHLIFTSKQAVRVFFDHKFNRDLLKNKIVFAIGAGTAADLEKHGLKPTHVPKNETQEGLIALLETLPIPKDAYFFYPRSSRARPLLADFLCAKRVRTRLLDLYKTRYQKLEPVPNLDDFDRIVFTSPSTVRGFMRIFKQLPKDKDLVAIGPITAAELKKFEKT